MNRIDTKDLTHIGLESPVNFADLSPDDDINYLGSIGVNVKIRENKLFGQPLAMSFLVLGTACVVYLLKPFFEEFLKEAGKDSYSHFKKWLIKYVVERRKIKVITLTASQSLDKDSKTYDQSKSISIKAIISDEFTITVLIDDKMDEENLEIALDRLCDQLLRLNNDLLLTDESQNTHTTETSFKKIHLFLIFNDGKKEWEILTQNQVFKKYKN